MARDTRALIALAGALVALGSAGCWWPIQEGGHGRDEGTYRGERQGPERHGEGGHHDGGHDGDHD